MAHVFVGNRAKVDEEVLRAIQRLSDEFWVFTEFDVNGRNVDWLVIRQVPDNHPIGLYSTFILTELKRTSAILDGDENSRWREQRDGEWNEFIPRNMDDINPWRQLINTVNRFRDWFANNQRRFVDPAVGTYTPSDIRVWPALLIVSDPRDLVHRLPFRPQNNFGAFHFDLDHWHDSLERWAPKVGVRLNAREIADLARVLGLHRLEEESRAPAGSIGGDETTKINGLPPLESDSGLEWAPEWVAGLVRWAADVERRLRAIEDSVSNGQPAGAGTVPPRRPAPPVPVDRPLTQEEIRLIHNSMDVLKHAGKRRDFPSLFAEMGRQSPGPSFKERDFNGYGGSRAMMDRAVREGHIRYGPPDANGDPTVLFPKEEG